MKRALLFAVLLVGCGGDVRGWAPGEACAKPADCGDTMYCVTSRLPSGANTPMTCQPECTAGAECSTGCCLPLTGFEPTWVCALPEACGL